MANGIFVLTYVSCAGAQQLQEPKKVNVFTITEAGLQSKFIRSDHVIERVAMARNQQLQTPVISEFN